MRHRNLQETGSLDLLLDAITNTFGGVLFLAVLIVILLQFTGDPVKEIEITPDEVSLQKEINQLEQDLESNQKMLKQLLGDQDIELAKAIVDLRKKTAALEAASNAEAKDKDFKRSNMTMLLAMKKAMRKKTDLEAKVKELAKKHSRSAKLPRLRTTNKTEYPVVVCGSRLHLLYDTNFDGKPTKVRLADLDIVTNSKTTAGCLFKLPLANGKVVTASPKPNAGFKLNDKKMLLQQLRGELRNLDPKEIYLAIAIWEDSFDNFGSLRNAVVELGFEYRLMPIETGRIVGSSASGEVNVQ